MKWMLFIFVAVAMVVGGYWVTKNPVVKQSASESEEILFAKDKLKMLYQEEEDIAGKIRVLQQSNKDYEELQNKILMIRDSIELFRVKIAEQYNNPLSSKVTKPSKKKYDYINLLSPKLLLAVVFILLLIIITTFLKNKIFGEKPVKNSLPGYYGPPTSAPPSPRPKEPKPTYSKPNTGDSDFRSSSTSLGSATSSLSDNNTVAKESSGFIHEQVIALANQGLSVREISNKLKIEQDKVSLALRLHGKK